MDCGIDITNVVEIDPTVAEHQKLLEAIQGNILKSHGRDRSIHLFVTFNTSKVDEVKTWIGNFGKEYVTSAYKQYEQAKKYRETKESETFVNFFLSMKGYMELGFSYSKTPTNVYFRGGMQDPNSLDLLKDPPVDSWETEFQNKYHALIIIADDDQKNIENLAKDIIGGFNDIKEEIHIEQGFVLRERPEDNTSPVIEHFGFRDGVSQPLFMKSDIEKAKSYDDFDKWDPRAPLNLVLVEDSLGTEDCSYGSYLVYRKLEQNVEGWNKDVLKLAEKLDNIEPALAGAYVMGRFQDGTPLVDSKTPGGDPNTTTNNFNYQADSEALKCPFHAHIRKTNPRGDTPDDFDNEKMHRIARRGISYGTESITDVQEESSGSGLLFLCFQADLGNQFIFMQSNWSNAPDFVERGVGADPVIGQGKKTETYNWPDSWGRPGKKEADFTKWVTMKGGEYFFAPSMSFFETL
ncbi:Dyp-type peroxidase [Dapis sp. BLCC M172]|uniref:Dyp-type peroxidase n=1 Tax=Dapis sp. BLCC M172 TaxID=2975281 RepID=UPI003CF3C1CE